MFTPFFVCSEIRFQVIREKKQPEYGKHEEKFDQDDHPERTAKSHTAKAVVIEVKYFTENSIAFDKSFHHVKVNCIEKMY